MLIFRHKNRYKPRYKICHSFNINIWGHNKIRRFRRLKWKFLKQRTFYAYTEKNKLALKRAEQNKKPIILYFRKQFKKQLLYKKHLRFFYGKIKDYQIRNLYHKSLCSRMPPHNKFIGFFEKRLDNLLVRIFFFRNIFTARQAILYGNICINRKIIYNPSHLLRIGDTITFAATKYTWYKIYSRIFNVFNQYSWHKKKKHTIPSLFFPQYLEINFKTLTGMLCTPPQITTVFYPSHMNIEYVRRCYF